MKWLHQYLTVGLSPLYMGPALILISGKGQRKDRAGLLVWNGTLVQEV